MGVSLAKQIAAASAAAAADLAAGNPDFYSEIGTASSGNTPLWSGSYGASAFTADTNQQIASASKPIYPSYVSTTMTLGDTDYPYFTMRSGYQNMSGQCAGTGTETVTQCLAISNDGGTTTYATHVGPDNVFAYDGGHMEVHAGTIATPSLAGNARAGLTSKYRTLFGWTTSGFTQVNVSGGLNATATEIRSFLQQVMNGTLPMKALLQDARAPVNASTYFTDGSVSHSPAPSNQPWQMKWGWWIEPGGGYYWGSGSFGFSYWISSDFSMYGIVSRQAVAAGGEMGTVSINTGQKIRKAFLTGGALPRVSRWSPCRSFGPLRNRTW